MHVYYTPLKNYILKKLFKYNILNSVNKNILQLYRNLVLIQILF